MGFVYVTGFLYCHMNVIPELKNNYKIIEFDWESLIKHYKGLARQPQCTV